LVLAILDGHHALYKVEKRLEERGMVPLLQPGLTRTALNRRFPRSEILQQSGMRLRSFYPENRLTCDGKVDRFILPSG
jgi:hypothetical protein